MNNAQLAYSSTESEEREQLLLEHLPEVRFIARRIHDRLPSHVPLEDLIHAGVLGLIDALNKYDPGKKVHFKSYAKFRIRGAILDSLREMDWGPRDLRRKRRRLEEADQQLRRTLGRAAGTAELADAMGMSNDELGELLRDLRGLELLSLTPDDSSDSDEPPREITASALFSPFDDCLRMETRTLLAGCIDELTERERQVLSLYYYEELTMKEVGAVLGVGESRVSQIHSLALLRLRHRLEERVGCEAASLRI